MPTESIIFEIIVIFAGTAILSTVFLFLKQPIIISYIALGMLAGPFGLGLIQSSKHIEEIAKLGIILLLFIIGLNLHPNKLWLLFRKTAIVTIITIFVFPTVFGIIAFTFGFTVTESLILGIALTYSSTIVGLKLTPTTTLHQKHLGEMMISVLLLQDILAIITIILIGGSKEQYFYLHIPLLIFKTIALVIAAFYFFKYFILWLFQKFDTIQEYILVLSLGWCLAIAGVSSYIGLSFEIGAFIAGTSFAISPIALVIIERLKPLREFFLILFFFAIGAQFDFTLLQYVFIPGLILSTILLLLKPFTFQLAFRLSRENKKIANELSFRLGQASEFSLLVAYIAFDSGMISGKSSGLIQLTTIITLIASTYIVISRFATPITADNKLRAD